MVVVMADPGPPAAWLGSLEAARPTTRRIRTGQWTIVVTRDRFADAVSCQMRAHDVTYAGGAVTFHFGAKVHTYEASYRIDDGPAISWRANAMTLAQTGALTPSDDLLNPSGGRVTLPAKLLDGAQSVTVRTSARARPRTFRIGDLAEALTTAAAAGCGPDFAPDSQP